LSNMGSNLIPLGDHGHSVISRSSPTQVRHATSGPNFPQKLTRLRVGFVLAQLQNVRVRTYVAQVVKTFGTPSPANFSMSITA
jgi:hypothetical protein